MSNPVPGLCPCCKDPQSSDFLQSIHSDGLFNMVQKLANHFGHGKLGRKYLFCDKCIGWGKIEVIRLRELTQPAGPSQQPGQLQQQQQQQQPVVVFQPADHSQPHYSPVSDPEGSHSTPEPFNVQLYSQQSRIGARLANPNDSPIHLAILPYFLSTGSRPSGLSLLKSNNPPQTLSAPLPSPLDENAQIWNMDSKTVDEAGDQTNQEPRERADQPE